MLEPLLMNQSRAGISEIEAQYITGSLLKHVPFVTPKHTNEDVLTVFDEGPDLISLAVTEQGKPVGLINRNIFLGGMTKPYRRELYARKSCVAFMDKEPLIIEQGVSIQTLSLQAAETSGKILNDGFIITDDTGNYLGLGTGQDLVKVISYLQAEKNRLVMESIHYASIIQKSFLRASKEDMDSVLKDYFMHWEPRDKVGGDYYFCRKFEDGFFFALIDCTGHGVPGAFMTLIMASFLDHILTADNRKNPALALSMMNRKVKSALGQTGQCDGDFHQAKTIESPGEEHSDDGMDTAFCWFSTQNNQLVYAGAKTSLFYIIPGSHEANVLEPDRKGVGYVDTAIDYTWTNRELALSPGMCIYLTTDGVIDQIGGPKHIAFGKKRFIDTLLESHGKPMAEQKTLLLQGFYDYQGKQKRRDDVTLAGFRL